MRKEEEEEYEKKEQEGLDWVQGGIFRGFCPGLLFRATILLIFGNSQINVSSMTSCLLRSRDAEVMHLACGELIFAQIQKNVLDIS